MECPIELYYKLTLRLQNTFNIYRSSYDLDLDTQIKLLLLLLLLVQQSML